MSTGKAEKALQAMSRARAGAQVPAGAQAGAPARAEARTDASRPVERRDCPYFGLDYYEEEFGAWFFGREAERSKIITNLRAARLTLLYAESGVGKSSLLRAGVAWRLRVPGPDEPRRRAAARYVPVVFSSWKDDPVPALIEAIGTAIEPFLAGRPKPELPTDRLDAAIEAAAGAVGASLLIMLDQFEEYFLYSSAEQPAERFADEIARCINRNDLAANFLIAIREDAYAGLGDMFKGRIANVYGNFLHIEYLDRASAEKAIREPLKVYNRQPGVSDPVEIQDELVSAVLDQVRAQDAGDQMLINGATATATLTATVPATSTSTSMAPATLTANANGDSGRVSTPLLQLVMERIWERERAEDSRVLRLSTLQKLEGVKKILDTHLEKALGALGRSDGRTAIEILSYLVTPAGGKIAVSVPDLARRTGRSEPQVGGVLEKLDDARIVRPVPPPPGQIPPDTQQLGRYEIRHDVLAPTINRMVNRTIAAREERRRARVRRRRLAGTAAGLLGLVLIAAVIELVHANTANRSTAQSRQLAAAADANAARDPELSALLALQALRLQDTSQAEAALRNALPQVQEIRTFRDGTTVRWSVFDPADAGEVASADKHAVVRIWDVKTGRSLMRLVPTVTYKVTGTADTVAFNATGTRVAVGYDNGMVALFSTVSRKEIPPIFNVGSTVNDVRFVGRTTELVIAARDSADVWRPRDNSDCCSAQFSKGANTIAVDPDNPREFALATDSGTVIWKLRGNLRPEPSKALGLGDNDAEFNSSGTQVVTANADGRLRIYDLATFKMVMILDAVEGNATSVAYSAAGNLIVAGYQSGTARVWDAATGLQLTLLAGNSTAVNTARFNAQGSEVVTASVDGTIRVWDAQPRELRTRLASSYDSGTPSRPNPAYAAQYSPDGRRMVVLDASGYARVFTADGKPVLANGLPVVIGRSGTFVRWAQFNRAGTEIVTADSDGTVDLWHASGSNYTQIHPPSPIYTDTYPAGSASYADFSPDGSRIVIVTSNDLAEVRSARTGNLLRTLNPGHHFLLSAAVFSPDGRQVLTGDENGEVEVWNVATGHEMHVLGRPGPATKDAEFDSNGTEFLTASVDGLVTIWNAHDNRKKLSINACPTPNKASFSPDDSKIVVACGDGSMPVFDAATGQLLTVLSDAGTVNTAVFSPDGKSILTTFGVDGAGGVRIWNSQLAISSIPALEKLAAQRISRKLTAAERKIYLVGIRG